MKNIWEKMKEMKKDIMTSRRQKRKNRKKRKIYDMGKNNNSLPFVICKIKACHGRWNINMSDECPICGYNFITKLESNDNKVTPVTKPVTKPIINTANIGMNDSWEVKIDCVKDCSKAPDNKTIWFTPKAKLTLDYLMEKFPSIEWLAYLIGSEEEEYLVKELFIPEQKVTAASVTDIKCEEWNDLKVIGVIHSHHGMGNGFSGTDHEWINQNHNISLVISKTGIAGQVRWKTPCGSIKIIKANVKLKMDVKIDEDALNKIINEKIKTAVIRTVYGTGFPGGYHYIPNKTFTGHAVTKDVEKRFTPESDEWEIDDTSLADELSKIEEEEIINLNEETQKLTG